MKPIATGLLFSLMYLVVVLAQAQPPLWFEDNFTNNTNRWRTVTEYDQQVKHNALFVDESNPFILEAAFDASKMGTNYTYGLAWGRQGPYKYYLFEVNNQQEFRIGYRLGKDYNILLSWKAKRKIIQADKNVLEVHRDGSNWVFYINSKKVYEMPAMKFYNTGVALHTSSENIVCERFAHYQDMGAINVAQEVVDLKLKKENLGAQVNSKYIDKAPVVSPDGKTIYFIVEDHPKGYGAQDIWVTEAVNDSVWSAAVNIGRPLNNSWSNFVNAVLPGNNTLLIINNYETRQTDEEIIAFAHRQRDGWGLPQSVRIEKANKLGRWVSFRLAADGKTLIYSMKRADSYGGRDVYVSFLQKNGAFSPPKNLGSTINTPGNEHCPFLAADGVTLYFDTDGHPGYGGRDIFMARRLDDTWTNWSTPQNLGPAINTAGADENFMIPASGNYAYVASDENSYGGLDIFRLKLPSALKPQPTALLIGNVIETSSKMGVETIVRAYHEGKEVAYTYTDLMDGSFQFALPGDKKYTLIADFNPSMERLLDTLEIDLAGLPAYEERLLQPIHIEFIPRNTPVSIEPVGPVDPVTPVPDRADAKLPFQKTIYFASAEYLLTDSALMVLDELAQIANRFPESRIEIYGHTDDIGTLRYNQELAIARVGAALRYLEYSGVARTRCLFKGYGEEQPVATNETDEGRANNRRVEFRVVAEGL